MTKLSFLAGLAAVSLVQATTKEPKAVKESSRVEKNPTNGADFRIMHTGKIYPSQEFADQFGLEYQNKDSQLKSFGLDIFNSANWGALKDAPQMLLGYIIDQEKPKVELFAGVRYNEDGTPKNSVLEQGTTLTEDVLELIATSLGYSAAFTQENETTSVANSAWEVMLNGRKYVDFYMVRDVPGTPFLAQDGIYNIPKTVARGPEKGQVKTQRRERITILPIVEYTDEVRNELNGVSEGETPALQEVEEEVPQATEVTDVTSSTDVEQEETADEMFARLSEQQEA